MKLALKNKMHNTIKLETQDQRALQSTRGQLLRGNYKVHYPVDKSHMNFLFMFKLGCVSTGKGGSCFYVVGERDTSLIAHKKHFITPNPV